MWHYKSLSSRRNAKHHKPNFESIAGGTSQQSLSEEFMSSRASVKSENSTYSAHSGSVSHELSKLATSSDSLAHSDLLRPAGSQESLVNLRVSDTKHMSVDYDDSLLGMGGGVNEPPSHHQSHSSVSSKYSLFSEPNRIPLATPQELMKELLLSTAPGGGRSHSIYSDSIFSEVGSECFEKRLEDTSEKDLGMFFYYFSFLKS